MSAKPPRDYCERIIRADEARNTRPHGVFLWVGIMAAFWLGLALGAWLL